MLNRKEQKEMIEKIYEDLLHNYNDYYNDIEKEKVISVIEDTIKDLKQYKRVKRIDMKMIHEHIKDYYNDL